jgi:hypothetical protein
MLNSAIGHDPELVPSPQVVSHLKAQNVSLRSINFIWKIFRCDEYLIKYSENNLSLPCGILVWLVLR